MLVFVAIDKINKKLLVKIRRGEKVQEPLVLAHSFAYSKQKVI